MSSLWEAGLLYEKKAWQMRVEQLILRKALVTVSHKMLTYTLLMEELDEQMVDWNLVEQAQHHVQLGWVTRGVLQRSVLGPAPISLCMNDLDDGHSVPAEFCRLQNWQEWLIHQRVMLPSRGTSTGRRNGLTGAS